MTLADAKVGMTVRVDSVEDSPIKQRILSMGLIPGTRIEILQSAPLGDPIAIRLRAYNLALRKEDAKKVVVSY